MEFRLLGPLEVVDGGTPVEITGAKRKAVLAMLILRANEVVGRERLIDELWGEQAPRNAAAALQNHLSRLRKLLGPDLLARREWGYVLRTPPETIDLHRFELLRAEAEPLPAKERARTLADALALWRGPPLADLASEPGLQQEIARLEELRLATLEQRIDADLETGRNSELVAELETLIAQHPLREHLRGQLILSLYRAGRQAEALEVYRETRRVLAEELGLDPSPALRELEKAILRHDPALALPPPLPPQRQPESTSDREPSDDAPPPPKSKRRRLLVGILGVLVLGSGAAAAVALIPGDHTIAARTLIVTTETTLQQTTQPHTHTTRRHQQRPQTTPNQTHITVQPPPPSPAKPIPAQPPTHKRPARHRTPPAKPPQLVKTVTTAPAVQPMPVRIADDFSDPTLDPLIWSAWSSGTGTSFTQANGQLVFSIAANATFDSQYHGAGNNIGTKCQFPGDFDARVDYTLQQWPAANGAAISLIAYQTGPVELLSRTTATWGDGYNAWPNGGGVGPLPDTSGSLRMTRSNGVVRVFFWHHDQWKELGEKPISGEIWIGVSIGTNANDWRQQDVSAAFDNFVLTASDAQCPAGSDPRNP